jgi:hypothetical protein
MLVSVSEPLKPGDFVQTKIMIPTVHHSFGTPLQAAVADDEDWLGGAQLWPGWERTLQNDVFDDALQHLLDSARDRNRSRFTSLDAKNYGYGRSHLQGKAWRKLFIENSLDILYEWRPMAWSILEDSELCAIESVLTRPWTFAEQDAFTTGQGIIVPDANLHYPSGNTKWYFSAASVAIGFCESGYPFASGGII